MTSTLKSSIVMLQLVFALLFCASLAASFFLVDVIAESSRQAVTDKVVAMTRQKALIAEQILRTKAAEKYLPPYQRDALQHELESFKQNPDSYVRAVVEGHADSDAPKLSRNSALASNPLSSSLLEKMFFWKSSLKSYFASTFDDLLFELRIFLLSNTIGLLFAAWIMRQFSYANRKMVAISLVLTASIVLSSIAYLDRNWLFSILLKDYLGWTYPLGILSLCIWLCIEYFNTQPYTKSARARH